MGPISSAEWMRLPRCAGPWRRAGGATAVELLLALPIVILLGLGVVQFCLVYQARHALEHALATAARHGTVAHASSDAILAGLAAGLAPYLYGADDHAGLVAAESRARQHVDLGLASGWIRLRQRSPTLESFGDWAEAALDERGEGIPGVVEIPNDNLDNRRLRTQPSSGVAGAQLGEPIGRLSGQSLADANLLRLELAYGVRMAVPVVGRLVLRTLAWWHGCGAAGAGTSGGVSAASSDRLGLLRLPLPGASSSAEAHWACAFYRAQDAGGEPDGRIPLVASATMRMMSTARLSGLTVGRSHGGASGRNGEEEVAPSPGRPGDLAGGVLPGEPNPRSPDDDPAADSGAARVGQPRRQPVARPGPGEGGPAPSPFTNGFLQIGSDRAYPVPQPHPALCNG